LGVFGNPGQAMKSCNEFLACDEILSGSYVAASEVRQVRQAPKKKVDPFLMNAGRRKAMEEGLCTRKL
jgi:hypothetical protein